MADPPSQPPQTAASRMALRWHRDGTMTALTAGRGWRGHQGGGGFSFAALTGRAGLGRVVFSRSCSLRQHASSTRSSWRHTTQQQPTSKWASQIGRPWAQNSVDSAPGINVGAARGGRSGPARGLFAVCGLSHVSHAAQRGRDRRGQLLAGRQTPQTASSDGAGGGSGYLGDGRPAWRRRLGAGARLCRLCCLCSWKLFPSLWVEFLLAGSHTPVWSGASQRQRAADVLDADATAVPRGLQPADHLGSPSVGVGAVGQVERISVRASRSALSTLSVQRCLVSTHAAAYQQWVSASGGSHSAGS